MKFTISKMFLLIMTITNGERIKDVRLDFLHGNALPNWKRYLVGIYNFNHNIGSVVF